MQVCIYMHTNENTFGGNTKKTNEASKKHQENTTQGEMHGLDVIHIK